MTRFLPYAVFTALMFAIGFTAAAFSMPGEWYASIAKPWFNPPNWVFGPVWTLLYVLIGIAGAIAWRSAAGNVLTMLWAVQVLLNGAWSIVFFRWQNPDGALAVVLALLGRDPRLHRHCSPTGSARVAALRALCAVGIVREHPQLRNRPVKLNSSRIPVRHCGCLSGGISRRAQALRRAV